MTWRVRPTTASHRHIIYRVSAEGRGLVTPPLGETLRMLRPLAPRLEVLNLGGNRLGGEVRARRPPALSALSYCGPHSLAECPPRALVIHSNTRRQYFLAARVGIARIRMMTLGIARIRTMAFSHNRACRNCATSTPSTFC